MMKDTDNKWHGLLNKHQSIFKYSSVESVNAELDTLFGAGGWSLEFEYRGETNKRKDIPGILHTKTEEFEGLCYIRLTDGTVMKGQWNHIDDADILRSEYNSKLNHKQYPGQFTDIASHLISGFDKWNDIPYTSNIIHRSNNIIILEYFADYQKLSIMDLVSSDERHAVESKSLLSQPLASLISQPLADWRHDETLFDSAKKSETYKDIISQLHATAVELSFEDHGIHDRHISADDVKIPYVRPFSTDKLMTVIPDSGNIVSLYDPSSIIIKKDPEGDIIDWKYCELDLIAQPMFNL